MQRNNIKLSKKPSDNEHQDKLKSQKDILTTNFLPNSHDLKWNSIILRFIFGLLLIVIFSLIIKTGPIGLVFLVILIYLCGFHELSNVGYDAFCLHNVPHYRTISYILLIIFNYYIFGNIINERFASILSNNKLTLFLSQHHQFLSFNLYTIYLIIFVLTLQKAYYHKQYILFAYSHMLMFAYVSCYMTIKNILEGTIWFIVPVLLVVFNDIAAYLFGYFYGKIKLIDISPNKTWEGFCGAFFTTMVFGQFISSHMCQYQFFISPYFSAQNDLKWNNSYLFEKKSEIFGIGVFPFQKHALVFSLYASLVAPFGGFFASGFKRAIGIKDFGNTIPGHGGIIDRFDCQIIMNLFVNLYINSIKIESYY